MAETLKFQLETKPFLGTQVFMCPVCDKTRVTNLVEPKCLECKALLELVEYNPDAKWDFNGQEIFLTWAQTPGVFTPDVVKHVVDLQFANKSFGLENHLITREVHQNGGFHIHGYFRFEKRFRTQNRNFFDLGLEDTNITPNWQRVRGNKHKLFAYIKKDGPWDGKVGYITDFDPRPRVLQIVEDCETDEEFYEKLAYVTDGYWRVKSAMELWKLKQFKKTGCGQYHKWVATPDDPHLLACPTCEQTRDITKILAKGLGGNSI